MRPAIFFILLAKESAEIRPAHSDRNQPRAANFALASGTCNAAVNQPVNWETVSVGVFADAITRTKCPSAQMRPKAGSGVAPLRHRDETPFCRAARRPPRHHP